MNLHKGTTSNYAKGRFWLFFLCALVIFWPARKAGFVADWAGGQEMYETGTVWGALESFGWRAILPFMFLSNFIVFKAFGTWWLPWFVIFTGLHAFNASQILRLLSRLIVPSDRTAWVPFLAASLFLVSPYAAEPIVWKSCIHYQLGFALFLTAALIALDYIAHLRIGQAVSVWGLCLVGIYLSEWLVIAPALLAFLTFTVTLADGGWKYSKQRFWILIAPLFTIVVAWLFINKYTLGHWSGHYGDETHLHLDPYQLGSNALKYIAKYWLFVRYLNGEWQGAIYGFLDSKPVLNSFALIFSVFFGYWAFYFKKLSPQIQWTGFAFGIFFGAILPVCNLYFYTLLYSENDRYSYFASAFVWLPVLLLLSYLPRWINWALSIGIVGLSTAILVRMCVLWGRSESVYASLIEDFRWFDKEEVIILAAPDNYKGILIARIYDEPSGFKTALWQRRGQQFEGKIWDAVHFNMTKPSDGVKVETDSTGLTYKVSFMQDGNWFWREGKGAESYSTDAFSLKKNEWDCTVTLKRKSPTTAVIYPVGGRWIEVK